MRTLKYASQTFVTTDEMAHAVIEFTAEMAKSEDSEAVTLPTVDAEGRVVEIDIVVGPASEVISTPADDRPSEIDTTVAVAEIERRIESLKSARNRTAFPLDEGGPATAFDDLAV
ncbi:hypothetical protein [Marisediminicola sp. LYQ134]|uniref:hypothetical protein n=1 Tax=Marisediminicola sp. LYQ134 TaxID=3391061 RepID=UPI0039835FB4